MSRPSTVGQRVERILSETGGTSPLGRLKGAIVCLSIAPLIAIAAGCSWRAEAQNPAPSLRSSISTIQRTVSTTSNGGDEAFAVVTSDSQSVHGSQQDARRAQLLRDRIQGDYLWFERGLKFYYVTDADLVERAKQALKPEKELGRQQANLGAEQAKLGEQQARLGEQQSRVSVPLPDLTANIDSLRAKLSGSAGKQLRQEELGNIQAEIGDLQARVGDLQARAGGDQARLGEEQAKLGEEQARLGAQQAALGEKQARLAEEAQDHIRQLIDEALRRGLARPVE